MIEKVKSRYAKAKSTSKLLYPTLMHRLKIDLIQNASFTTTSANSINSDRIFNLIYEVSINCIK